MIKGNDKLYDLALKLTSNQSRQYIMRKLLVVTLLTVLLVRELGQIDNLIRTTPLK